jgi:hypothetical protein
MATLIGRQDAPATLAAALTGIRRRWRTRHVAVGLAIAVGVVAVATWIAALVMESLRFSVESVQMARWGVGLATGLVCARWILYPLFRRVGDAPLALYVEERVPELDGALISAVEVQQRPADEAARSPLLVQGLIGDAVRRVRQSPRVEGLESPATSRALAIAALIAVGLATVLVTGPDYLREGARLLVTPWKDPAGAPVYSIDITPGDAVVAKGSDVQIGAALVGFTSELVEVAVRRGTSAEWERVPMGIGADSTAFVARIFDLTEDAEYYVESNGVRSRSARLTVKNLPAVSGVDLELTYPAYSGLPPERIEDGGDIAALRGTRAQVRVRTTRAVRGGRLLVDDGSSIPLVVQGDTVLAATIVVRRDGFYRIDLEGDDGTQVPGSVEYVVDALEDGDPTVTIAKPGRDLRPSAVDEVFVEVLATDDFGVGKIELVYRVNGGAEQVVSLYDGTGRRPREMTAGHTMFLEEQSLQPGDIVSYYARAWDNDGFVRGGKKAASDIYFLTIRPFSREYRQNQQGGGGGGGGGEQNPGELVQLQREVIAATYKADRDSAKTAPAKYRADVATIHLSQGRLREQLGELIARVRRPAVMASDTTFGKLAELLPKAEEEMKKAEGELVERRLKSAMEPEQRALQWLERAEALYREVQVSMQQGGGGGSSAAQAEDLADLLELENDKLRNQYEQAQRSTDQQQGATAQVDSTLEALRRLAARQQQENERARQRLSGANSSGSGGGGSQRQLADETEELARQLERLAREQSSSEMQEAARELRDAANAMRRSASSSGSSGRSGASASDQLESARRLMDEARQRSLTSGVEEAAQQARQLAEQQRGVRDGVEQLPRAGAGRAEQEQRLMERKQEMANAVDQLQGDLDRLAREQRREQGGAARQLQESARTLREGRLADHMRYSAQRLRDASPAYANNYERNIQDVLDSLSTRLSGISSSTRAGTDSSARNARALAQARDLVRAMSSLDERMRERLAQRDSSGGRGLAGGRGLDSAAAQSGQQRRGQSEQQGQSGQGQGQGQQGQQGQGQQGQGQPGQGRQGQQGQGQQGQGGQGGGGARRLADDRSGGMPGQRTPAGQIGGGGQGMAFGRLSPEDVRQFSRELREQRDAADVLRRELALGGISTADLERLIARMRELEAGRVFDDPEELERLRGALVEGLKEFEFGLRRQLGARESGGPVLGGSDDVPQAYRDLVSEYFRSLTRKSKP